jgi:pimeloyl-ACP methyl ester carboxylesterase
MPTIWRRGISYGGELTMVFALRHPERCKKLIIADAVSHIDPQLHAIAESWGIMNYSINQPGIGISARPFLLKNTICC